MSNLVRLVECPVACPDVWQVRSPDGRHMLAGFRFRHNALDWIREHGLQIVGD